MSMQNQNGNRNGNGNESDLEIFERAVEAKGRLLRVDADRAGPTPRRLALTFDVGRILLEATADGLTASSVAADATLPEGLDSLAEEEPWWRLLGNPITAAWPGDAGEAAGARSGESLWCLKLRFREEADHARIVLLEAAGPAVRVSLEG